MKRTPLILVTAGALTAAALVGTALANGGDDGTRNASVPPAVSAAPTGDPTPTTPTSTPTTSTSSPATGNAPVSRERAVDIAISTLGGGTPVEVEQEGEHDRSMWSVRIRKDGIRHRVDIDRSTGRVTRTEQTRAPGTHGGHRNDDHGGRRTGTDDGAGDDHGGSRNGR